MERRRAPGILDRVDDIREDSLLRRMNGLLDDEPIPIGHLLKYLWPVRMRPLRRRMGFVVDMQVLLAIHQLADQLSPVSPNRRRSGGPPI
jgi:hypothetical protein